MPYTYSSSSKQDRITLLNERSRKGVKQTAKVDPCDSLIKDRKYVRKTSSRGKIVQEGWDEMPLSVEGQAITLTETS